MILLTPAMLFTSLVWRPVSRPGVKLSPVSSVLQPSLPSLTSILSLTRPDCDILTASSPPPRALFPPSFLLSPPPPPAVLPQHPPPPHSLPILGVSPPFLPSPGLSPWYQGDQRPHRATRRCLTLFYSQCGTITVWAYLEEYPASHSAAASGKSPGPGQSSPTSREKVWRKDSRSRSTSPSRTGGSWRPASVLLMLRYVLPSPLGILWY